uniref:UMA domain-containing protein n=1 Tax=Amblyomma aureolatum TaxID=187763 RepID=A0A1E1WZC1_9ACAR
MFSSIFGRKRAPAEQPAVVQESQQGDFVVFESPAVHTQFPAVQEHSVGAPPEVAAPQQQQHRCLGIDGVPFQLNVLQPAGDVDALLRRLRTMGADLSWMEYDYTVERRIMRDYA